MKATLAIAAAVTLASAVAAQDEGRLWYTEPVGTTVWTAGSEQTVSWQKHCSSENPDDLRVSLYHGGAAENVQVLVPGIGDIGTINCKKSLSGKVKLPDNLETGKTYSIHISTEPLQSYSARFTINGKAPGTGGIGGDGGSGGGSGGDGGAPGTGGGAPGTGGGAPGTGGGAPGTGGGAPGTGAPGTGAPGTGAPGTGAPGTGAPGGVNGTATVTTSALPTASTVAPTPSAPASAGSSLKTLGSFAAAVAVAVGAALF
ncbi:hypothetical protein BGX34_006484 [Mortierella sp. NVP85]|nr:hypothetical protein BGX34_006484 [Mortierella sp. NVP85]